MFDIYLRAFRLYHKNYLPQTLACLLATIGEAILYIFIVFCFENLSVQNEPLQNGLLVLVLGLAGLFIRLISDLNLLEYGMARPTSDLQSGLFRHFLRIPARHYPALSFGELSNVLFSQTFDLIFVETEILSENGINTKKRPANDNSAVSRGPLVEIGSLAICTKISSPTVNILPILPSFSISGRIEVFDTGSRFLGLPRHCLRNFCCVLKFGPKS